MQVCLLSNFEIALFLDSRQDASRLTLPMHYDS